MTGVGIVAFAVALFFNTTTTNGKLTTKEFNLSNLITNVSAQQEVTQADTSVDAYAAAIQAMVDAHNENKGLNDDFLASKPKPGSYNNSIPFWRPAKYGTYVATSTLDVGSQIHISGGTATEGQVSLVNQRVASIAGKSNKTLEYNSDSGVATYTRTWDCKGDGGAC